MVRARGALVRSRTLLVNHVRCTLNSFGVRLPACTTAVLPRRAAWKIPRDLRVALIPVLRNIADLTKQIVAVDRVIERVGKTKYSATQKLLQVDGVGTDFSQTQHLDRWNADGVEFVFGYQAAANLREKVGKLPESAWSIFERKQRYEVRTEPRTRPRDVKADIVLERELYNLHLCKEDVAEFDYQPGACKTTYRMVVIRKLITHERGQRVLFPELRYLFYITNKRNVAAADVVEMANKRCNQERTIGELKSGVNALGMPLGDLNSNWVYMGIATLAWNLSRWVGLMLPEPESGRWAKQHTEERSRVTTMRFRTFVQSMMTIPAQIARSGRQLVIRLLDRNPWRLVFFRALDAVRLM